jgi:tubulin-specific chaperone D
MLRALLLNQSDIDWQERYIMLLWLSHLVLTPFDLQSISSSHEPLLTQALLPEELSDPSIPGIVSALVSAGLENLGAASKERESASRLIVRIALRPDMQRLGQLDRLVKLMLAKLEEYTQRPTASMYECLGYLSVISGIVKTGSADDVSPLLTTIIDACLEAATIKSAKPNMIRASAPARKMLVAILRASMLHAITLNSRDGIKQISNDALYGNLEGIIQYLLDALGDKDTPVRLAASKALSVLVQKLDGSMKTEIVQAVLDTLEEDVLYKKSESGDLKSVSLLTQEDKQRMSRNLTAVSPLNWQGLLLTLGHLLFRRTVPPDQLSPVLKSLLSGLEFEQRSATGTSIGGSVRDAACFGFWSLARKYATSELQAIEPTSILPALKATFSTTVEASVLQIVANHLVVSACLDPSGNIRRGSSAALQELIGRHPDMIIQGIALVQIVDYHAVARRSRAMLEVAGGAAELDNVYRWVLLNALLGWRGARAVDDDSRRIAAVAISKLVSSEPLSDRCAVLEAAHMQLSRLPTENSKTIVEARHGLLMTVSRILAILQPTSLSSPSYPVSTPVASMLQLLWGSVRLDGQLLGNLKGRFISELILEGAASLMFSLASADSMGLSKSSERAIEVLNLCLTRADHDIALLACADASFELLSRLPTSQRVELVESWLDSNGRRHPSFSCKGRILALGNVYGTLPVNPVTNHKEREVSCKSNVFAQLTEFVLGNWPIETQVIALRSLKSTITHLEAENCERPLSAGLDNYANDHRGDVGSLARFEAVKAVSALLTEWTERQYDMSNHQNLKPLVQRVFRLAGEKLDKLRFEAWNCIEVYMRLVKMHSAES